MEEINVIEVKMPEKKKENHIGKMTIRKRIFRPILKFFAFVLFVLPFRIKIFGQENIKEGTIICPNHKTTLDAMTLTGGFKKHVSYMAKDSIWKNPFLRAGAYIFDMIPVKRNGKDISALKTGLSVVKNGGILGIFPEGTRNGIKKGKKIKSGTIAIAIKEEKEIIRVGISGDFKLLRSGNYVTVGKGIDFANIAKINGKTVKDIEFMNDMASYLQEKILSLVNEKEYVEFRMNKEEKESLRSKYDGLEF